MLKFNVVRDEDGDITHIETALTGYDLLGSAKLNKGCAFTPTERRLFHLNGLLPHQVETLEQQVSRMYAQYQEHGSNLSKNIYLNVLHDYNETLFYKLASEHLEEILPIVYTPTVGAAVERFSLELRKPRGLYISYEKRDQIKTILDQYLSPQTNLIVVTDGEAVLGIGDQGIGGIKICNAKSMMYTLCGGLNPHYLASIQLDVGTNNPHLLSDPMYLGWRHERIVGQDYDNFIELFVSAVKKKLPYSYLHWEDFGRDNARRILTHYRNDICTLNGDMQSTGAVALACVLAGCAATRIPLTQQRIVIFGAGTAGVGIADQIIDAMVRQGLSEHAAYQQFWLLDKQGLLIDKQTLLLPFQKPYARLDSEITTWQLADNNFVSLLNVVEQVKPTILIGCSTLAGAFNKQIIQTMAKYVENPIIMPLSNPTLKAEATPNDILNWTEGRAIIATGSPFANVTYGDRTIRIAQSNNVFAFPGIGLGAIAVKAKQLSDGMIWAAVDALSQCSPAYQNKTDPLLPTLSEAPFVSRRVALAVADAARKEGLAQIPDNIELDRAIKYISWEPKYYPYKP